MVRQFYPQPGSVEWFQPFGLCHWLCDFQLELARRAVPDLIWRILRGPHHTTVVGRRPGAMPHEIVQVFDILREGEPAEATIRDSHRLKYRKGEYNQETGLVVV